MPGVSIRVGKKERPELELPRLHFIAMDDWTQKLGERAFVAWLKLYTLADRRGGKKDDGDSVPTSLSKLAKKLGCSKQTMYDSIIRPLYNYGFIDLEEYETRGLPAINITVYDSPCNKTELSTKPLIKIRDYDTDWLPQSKGKKHSEKAFDGQPQNQISNTTGLKIRRDKILKTGLKIRRVTSLKIRRVTGLKIGHNNIYKSFNDFKYKQHQKEEETPVKNPVDVVDRIIDLCIMYNFLNYDRDGIIGTLNDANGDAEKVIAWIHHFGNEQSKPKNPMGLIRTKVRNGLIAPLKINNTLEQSKQKQKTGDKYDVFYQYYQQ